MGAIDGEERLVVAVSSRALFDLEESECIYRQQGHSAFEEHQRQHKHVALLPGPAFPLVRKLLALNQLSWLKEQGQVVEVVLVSRNNVAVCERIWHSVKEHALSITRAAFTSGANPYLYAKAFGATLFISADESDVKKALEAGLAAVQVSPLAQAEQPAVSVPTNPAPAPEKQPTVSGPKNPAPQLPLRIAFDGDCVLFGSEAQMLHDEKGLATFKQNEQRKAHIPLSAGPLKPFLQDLERIRAAFPLNKHGYPVQAEGIRTALVTARDADTHQRVLNTLHAWGVRVDEALFLGGLEKGPFLKAFGADFFIDDNPDNIRSAQAYGIASAVVPTTPPFLSRGKITTAQHYAIIDAIIEGNMRNAHQPREHQHALADLRQTPSNQTQNPIGFKPKPTPHQNNTGLARWQTRLP